MQVRFWKCLAIICVAAVVSNTDGLTANASAQDSDYYTAGVVEFRPIVAGMSSQDMLVEHLQAYSAIIHSAEASATDIIVFPEGTLNSALQMTHVPNPNDNIAPCDYNADYADFLVHLSCVAREVRKYLVINLTEKENCSTVQNDPRPCATNGLNVFNTNVVFDRMGFVVSRYRKVHIYLEAKNTTYQPEFAIFETDFGVRFAHFICFDVLFYTPAQELVRTHKIEHFIFTSMFYSELPFLTAVQLQQSWAWANDVNLLAAGASYPQAGMSGSGIYAGQNGAVNALMVGDTGERKLLVAKLAKNGTRSIDSNVNNKVNSKTNRQTGLKLMQDYQMENYTTELVDFDQTRALKRQICDATGFCCQFNIETQPLYVRAAMDTQAYKYRLALFNGVRRYEQLEWSTLQICALIACTGVDLESCGVIYNATANVMPNFRFTTIEIEGNFTKTDKLLLMPNSLDDLLYPLGPESVQWRLQDRRTYYNAYYASHVSHDNLLTFGIYANYYDRSMALSTTFVMTSSILLACCMLLSMSASWLLQLSNL